VKAHWYKDGDRNTKIFHATSSAHRKVNRISSLEDDLGTKITDIQGMSSIAKSYFHYLFQKQHNIFAPVIGVICTSISNKDDASLTQPFTKEEFKQSIFSMHPDKCSGPDGYNPSFYQHFWDLCSDNIFTECCNLLEFGQPQCISDTQSAFVSGSSILDNVMVAIEVIHFMKTKTRGNDGCVTLKLDISNAYDRMDWDYLKNVMVKMGFSAKWIQWMTLCVESVDYSILVNNEKVGQVIPRRVFDKAILFHLIFYYRAEGLSSLIRDAEERRVGTKCV